MTEQPTSHSFLVVIVRWFRLLLIGSRRRQQDIKMLSDWSTQWFSVAVLPSPITTNFIYPETRNVSIYFSSIQPKASTYDIDARKN